VKRAGRGAVREVSKPTKIPREWQGLSHVNGKAWVSILLEVTPQAIADAVEALARCEDLSSMDGSTLAIIGNLVSKGIRRRVLLQELQATGWNLCHASERLRLGRGTGNILRAIGDLGLSDEYERVKAEGKVRIHGRKKRSLVAEMLHRPVSGLSARRGT